VLLTRRGFHVFATVRKTADGEELQRQTTGCLTPLLVDVTNHDQIAHARDAVAEHAASRGLDALVNNAGVGSPCPLELVPLDTLRRQLEVDVVGQLAVTQAFLPAIRQAHGRVVMIGSIAHRLTPPFIGALAASKHALLALSEALRQELAPWDIRVVLIEPGSIHTDAGGKFEQDAAATLRQFDPTAQALYAEAFGRMTARFGARHEQGSDPSVVAAAVAEAIDAPRPRARYLVGKDARRFALVAMLPPVVLDPLRRRIFGLPRPGAALTHPLAAVHALQP
jgi:NAD(P)-dependent dehydrogenase (short-subunit alcohol dehydrogenase family)